MVEDGWHGGAEVRREARSLGDVLGAGRWVRPASVCLSICRGVESTRSESHGRQRASSGGRQRSENADGDVGQGEAEAEASGFGLRFGLLRMRKGSPFPIDRWGKARGPSVGPGRAGPFLQRPSAVGGLRWPRALHMRFAAPEHDGPRSQPRPGGSLDTHAARLCLPSATS